MNETELSFDYDVELDGGVVDGRKLAAQMVVDAWRLLLPYVKGCPGCAENMLGTLAAREIEKVVTGKDWKAKDPSIRFWGKDIRDREAAFKAHLERTATDSAALLRVDHAH